jgi:hypothetical protein
MLTLTFDGVVATDGVDDGDGAGDDNPLTYDFNQISIGTSGAAFIDFVIDNVAVTSDAVNPCPADIAPPFGVLDLWPTSPPSSRASRPRTRWRTSPSRSACSTSPTSRPSSTAS